MVERETGAVVGYAGIELREGGPELGYSLARAAWGRGYATEAAAAWLGHAFGDLGLERVEALVAAANSASIHVLEKVGMHPAGERTVEGHAWLVYASSAASALAATSRSPL